MAISLQRVLTNNAAILGANCEHLGSRKGIYLSFSEENGWSVMKFEGFLGLFQQIFRWLGFYASTQLSRVVTQLRAEAEVPAPLLTKINACWTRQGGVPIMDNRPLDRRFIEVPFFLPPIAEPDDFPAGDLPLVQEAVQMLDFRENDPFNVTYRIPGSHTLIGAKQGNILQSGMNAIVTPTDPALAVAQGNTGQIIQQAAGPQLLQDLMDLPANEGVRSQLGHAVITRGHQLEEGHVGGNTPIARVIHAVIPYQFLRRPWLFAFEATRRALDLARLNGVRTVAFRPLCNETHLPWPDAVTAMCRAIHMYVQKYPQHFNEVQIFSQDEGVFTYTRDEMMRIKDIPAGQ